MKRLLPLIGALVGILMPLPAVAATIGGTVSKVGWMLPDFLSGGPGCTGGMACEFVDIVGTFMQNSRPLVFIGAVFVITIAGFRMVTTEEEESFTKSKRIISAALTGVVLSYLVEPFVNAFYGGLTGTLGGIFGGIGIGAIPQGNVETGAAILYPEIIGLINWSLVIIGTLAVFMIIISGLKAMTKAGGEEGIETMRRTVLYVIGGLIIIIFRFAINATFGLPSSAPAQPGSPSMTPVAIAVVAVVNFVLSFAAIVAVAVIIYAGLMMILNLGNEDQYTKAKTLIYRVLIGLVVIGISLAIVNFVIAAIL